MNKNYDAFSHGLVTSKLWLCEELENVIHNNNVKNPALNILGSWNNLLAFMLLIRKPNTYGVVNAYDSDPTAIDEAEKITDTWKHEYPKVYNHVINVDEINFSSCGKESIFINCSVDQFESTTWYDHIPAGRIVCIQSTDMTDESEPWLVKQSTKDIVELTNRYKVSKLLYGGSRKIEYHNWNYNRFLMIGVK
jgi:hypothetical protein